MEVNLTPEELQAFEEMLGEQTIEEYLKKIAASHLYQKKIDEAVKKIK